MTRDIEKTTPFVKDKATAAESVKLPAMFTHFKEAKNIKLPKWAGPLFSAMVAFHIVLFVTMWVKSIWDVEQLDRPNGPTPVSCGRRRDLFEIGHDLLVLVHAITLGPLLRLGTWLPRPVTH